MPPKFSLSVDNLCTLTTGGVGDILLSWVHFWVTFQVSPTVTDTQFMQLFAFFVSSY